MKRRVKSIFNKNLGFTGYFSGDEIEMRHTVTDVGLEVQTEYG